MYATRDEGPPELLCIKGDEGTAPKQDVKQRIKSSQGKWMQIDSQHRK
jgi:hypothetical protein